MADSSAPDYTSAGAADVELMHTCVVRSVTAYGRHTGSALADSETVTFYTNANGLPGSVINSQTVVGKDRRGRLTVPLRAVRLVPGRYWVSIQANMAGASPDQTWLWRMTTQQGKYVDVWRNPGGALGRSCPDWQATTTCWAGHITGADFRFYMQARLRTG